MIDKRNLSRAEVDLSNLLVAAVPKSKPKTFGRSISVDDSQHEASQFENGMEGDQTHYG